MIVEEQISSLLDSTALFLAFHLMQRAKPQIAQNKSGGLLLSTLILPLIIHLPGNPLLRPVTLRKRFKLPNIADLAFTISTNH
jgi:hypothetical protein